MFRLISSFEPKGTSLRSKVTVVESEPCLNVVVSVASCPEKSELLRQQTNLICVPEGHVGDCSDHVWTISLPGVTERYLPFTPPPNKEYSEPTVGVDCANFSTVN